MKNTKEEKSKLSKVTKSWSDKTVRTKAYVTSLLIASSIVGGTMITQGFDAGVEKKEEIITTIQPTYNYYEVSLSNEKQNGLLKEAEDEIQAQKELEEKRLLAEAEAKAKAEAEARAVAEAKVKAESEAKAKAIAVAKAKDDARVQAEKRARIIAETKAKEIAEAKARAEQKAQQGYTNSNIPLTKEVQTYLNKRVQVRGLYLPEVLAVMKVESSFNPNAVSGDNFGYFQINSVNHSTLSQKLGTGIKPLDPYVNIDWGTYMLSDLYKKYKKKGLSGQELREVVLSAYNKGEGGYERTGKAYSYINKVNNAQNQIDNWLK